jgi:Mg2+ and Co2+ transporter CorA
MMRRIEDRIRRLCQQLLAAKDDPEQIGRLGELRRELHLHIERLRATVAQYPLVVERRNRSVTDETPSLEKAAEQRNSAGNGNATALMQAKNNN